MLKFLGDTIGAVVASLVAIPLAIAYGIFVIPFMRASEAWKKDQFGEAAIYTTIGAWPAWAILGIMLFSK